MSRATRLAKIRSSDAGAPHTHAQVLPERIICIFHLAFPLSSFQSLRVRAVSWRRDGMARPRRSRCSVTKFLIGGLGCVSMVQIAILVAATVRGHLTMQMLEEAAEVAAAKEVAQLSHRWRAAVSRPLPTPPASSLLPPPPPPPLTASAARAGGPALARWREPSQLHGSTAAPASRTPAPLPDTIRLDLMGQAPAAEVPSEASMEEPAGKEPTNSSSSGGKSGKGGSGGKGGSSGKGGKGATAKSVQTKAKGATAKGGREKDREQKGKRKRGGESSKGERGKGGKAGKAGKAGKEHAAAWAASSTAEMSK